MEPEVCWLTLPGTGGIYAVFQSENKSTERLFVALVLGSQREKGSVGVPRTG
jgi:hypothetical protein